MPQNEDDTHQMLEDAHQMNDLEQAYLEAVKIREKLFLEVLRAKRALGKAELARDSAVMAASVALDQINGQQNGVVKRVSDVATCEVTDNEWRPNLVRTYG